MIGTLFPELCNQQGDQGFLDACRQMGIATRAVSSPEHLKGISLLYIGDSSITGERLLVQRVTKLVPKILTMLQEGMMVFAVGRSAVSMASLLNVASIEGSMRESGFRSVQYQGMELLGYVNGAYSQVLDSQQVGSGRFVQTGLLGPCLVVNPQLRNLLFEVVGFKTFDETALEAALREHYRKEV